MRIRRASVLLLAIVVTGCGIFSRPKNQFYSLDTIPPESGAVRSVTGVPVGIDGIELPPGLDRRGIFIRGENNKIEVRGTHQWTAPLEEMVIHTLAFDLAGRVPDGMIVLPGQAKPAAMRSLYVTFEDLAPGTDGVFILDARWTLGTTAGHERITVDVGAMDSPNIVTAMNRALATLADRIVARM